ncbi:hypothetical protein VPMS16_506 [Vibrio sp. 16]|nr:hypothetical protein VPMS16_506 [Vibrio sp. 16]
MESAFASELTNSIEQKLPVNFKLFRVRTIVVNICSVLE